MSKTEREMYYDQNLGQVWSFRGYRVYEGAVWHWHQLPFADDPCRRNPTWRNAWMVWPGSPQAARSRLGFRYDPDRVTKRVEGKTILEVGSAMGGAYAFMKSTGLVDLSGYTGLEVSDMGHHRSKERFPEGNWVQADFTRHELKEMYDYSFERHAVHHMPSPLQQYEKMARQTRLAMNCVFVGRIEGPTISDLNLAAYRYADQGVYYFNVISVLEVVRIGLDVGFNHIRICYFGDHEPCQTDPKAEQFMAREIQDAGVQRFQVRMSRCPDLKKPMIYSFPYRPGLWRAKSLAQLKRALSYVAASA